MTATMYEAVDWRLLGLLFERPKPGWLVEVLALSRETANPALKEAAAAAEGARQESYLRVLGPGGAVSPREVSCRPMDDPGKVLSELSGYYKAFAYNPQAEDPADHVAVEVGFVGYLKLKEAYAEARGVEEEAKITHEAAEKFLKEHLAGLAATLERKLADSPSSHLTRAAHVLKQLCPEPERRKSPLPVINQSGCALQEDDEVTCGPA